MTMMVVVVVVMLPIMAAVKSSGRWEIGVVLLRVVITSRDAGIGK